MSRRELRLTTERREDLLRDMWIAHDARWFMTSVQEVGFDTANKLNHAAVRSLGRKEIRDLIGETGFVEVKDIEDMRAVVVLAGDLYFPRKHKYEIRVLDDNSLLGRVLECYIWKNIDRVGALDQYRCAAASRFRGWIEGFGLEGEIVASGEARICNGACDIVFQVKWPNKSAP